MLLAKYLFLGRETKDLDFLALNFSNNAESIKSAFAEIAALDMGDGFLFNEVDTSILEHPHISYAGAEVTMTTYYGRTRFKLTIDIGFGDTVQPKVKQLDLMIFNLIRFKQCGIAIFEECVEKIGNTCHWKLNSY